MIIRFLHGWGFDSTLWDAVIALLPEHECRADDAGYFGSALAVEEGTLAVAHSYGAMRLLAAPGPSLRGLIAINGFDCFAAHRGFPGIAPRVLSRMQTRFAADPAAVLTEFRQRCGTAIPAPTPDSAALARDLAALAHDDRRGTCAVPVLSLQSADDPLLPAAMRDAVFASAPAADRLTAPVGGHLLPLTRPERCAAAIRSMVERLN